MACSRKLTCQWSQATQSVSQGRKVGQFEGAGQSEGGTGAQVGQFAGSDHSEGVPGPQVGQFAGEATQRLQHHRRRRRHKVRVLPQIRRRLRTRGRRLARPRGRIGRAHRRTPSMAAESVPGLVNSASGLLKKKTRRVSFVVFDERGVGSRMRMGVGSEFGECAWSCRGSCVVSLVGCCVVSCRLLLHAFCGG